MRHLLAALLALLPLTLAAQERRDVIAVLDMSGSMWGQVDGVAKVEIAREAFASLSADWAAAGIAPGLIAYGHRRRGDCADIETLAAPGAGADLPALVGALTPRGKTPLSDAVRQAAEALRYTEDAATVVLISDGVETCAADPCAMAAELESSGIDFTAHVVGFDIAEADRDQLRCIADRTGGLFFDAADASGLGNAMVAVARATTAAPDAAAEPAPAAVAPQSTELRVFVERAPGIAFPQPLTLSVDGAPVADLDEATARTRGLPLDLAPGTYVLTLKADRQAGELVVEVSGARQDVTIPLQALRPDWQLWSDGPFPMDGAAKQYVAILASGGAGRAGFGRLYLVRAGETDLDDFVSRTAIHAEADEWQFAQIDVPDMPGEYELVLAGPRDEGDIMRLPLTFAETVPPRWTGARQVAPGASVEARFDGDWGRQSTLVLSMQGAEDVSAGVDGLRDPGGFLFDAPSVPGLYEITIYPNVVSSIRGNGGVLMGQIAVGVPAPDGAEALQPPAGGDGMAEEAAAMGGEEEAALEPGELQGDWRLAFVGPQRSIDLLDVQLTQDAGGAVAQGGTVVRAGDDWGLGPTGGFGTMTLTRAGPDAYDIAVTGAAGIATGRLDRDGDAWTGTLRTDGPLDVALLRPGAAAPTPPKPNQLTAVDERGVPVAGPVEWALTRFDAPPETLRSDGPVLYEGARAVGAYDVAARAGGLSGADRLDVGPGMRSANRIVLRPEGEGATLPIDAAFFCSPGEDCAMRFDDLDLTFDLPVGWGATRPYADGDAIVVTFATLDPAAPEGALYATLNMRQRMASLGPCREVLRGTFCHDATNDPGRLTQVDALAASLSYLSAGPELDAAGIDAILQRLTGADR
ncbi:MAG: vWA domain-containing protein [Paracoccaceae bacterium]